MLKRGKSISRNSCGGMSLLVILSFWMVAMAILAGLSFSSIFFFQSELQKLADDLSLAGACQLNEGNRIGQMNHLITRCRQLVLSSEQATESTIGSSPELQMLSQQLFDEAQQNAQQLEGERARLQKLSVTEANTAMSSLYKANQSHYDLSFPWIKVKIAPVVSTQFGSVKGLDSNVIALNAVDDLTDYDLSRKYIDKKTGLYCGHIDAPLPPPINNLSFRLASLAAPVKGHLSPARLMQANSTIQLLGKNQPIPSTVTVGLEANISTQGYTSSVSVLRVSSTAAATGASPSVK
jgi:hypothetical protein